MHHSPEIATEIEEALRAKGYKFVTKDFQKVNWDEANQRYLPSTYTYTVSVKLEDAKTGNLALEIVASPEDVEAAIKRAKAKIAPKSLRTRQAIAAENSHS